MIHWMITNPNIVIFRQCVELPRKNFWSTIKSHFSRNQFQICNIIMSARRISGDALMSIVKSQCDLAVKLSNENEQRDGSQRNRRVIVFPTNFRRLSWLTHRRRPTIRPVILSRVTPYLHTYIRTYANSSSRSVWSPRATPRFWIFIDLSKSAGSTLAIVSDAALYF